MTLGRQFVTLYRGLHDVHPGSVDFNNLGIHWTTSKAVAENFGSAVEDESDKPAKTGVVIRAKVPKEHLHDRRTSEFRKLSGEKEIYYANSKEQEKTVRQGVPITGEVISHLTWSPKKGGKVKSIKKPFEGKA